MTRTVLVTGASSGIGRATALALAERGDEVVLVSRSRGVLEEVARECAARGGAAVVAAADVSSADDVRRAFAAGSERFGRVDAVVHSAAVIAYGRFADVPVDVFDQALRTTLGGTANVARSALAEFGADGGDLVVVGSLLGKVATPFMSSYVTAKWGVHGLVRTLQIEARATPRTRISMVWPGGVDTPVYRQAGSYLGRHGRPPPPIATAEKVAATVLRSLDHPRRERTVNLANHVVVAGFRAVPTVYDVLVTPLMRLAGLDRERTPEGPGNVLEPQPQGERVDGGWKRSRRRSRTAR